MPNPQPRPQRGTRTGRSACSLPQRLNPTSAPAAAPSFRKLARDLGIDLTKVRGSARGGRIVLDDVRAYIQRLQRLACAAGRQLRLPVQAAKPAPEQIDFSKWGSDSQEAA